jgi:hypothetical protein
MQLAAQQPDLGQMFGQDNLYSTLYGLQRQDQANAAANQNLQQAQQDYQFQAQNQPLNLAQAQANINHTGAMTDYYNAQTPGLAAKSQIEQLNANAESGVPQDLRTKSKINDIATNMTLQQAKQHEAQATSDLFATNPDGTPDYQKRSDAQMVLTHMPAILGRIAEINAQGANEANVAGIHVGGNLALENQEAAHGKYNKLDPEYLRMSLNSKANFQQQAGIADAHYNDAMSHLGTASTPEEKEYWQGLADNYQQQKQEAIYNDYRAKTAAAGTNLAGKPGMQSLGITPANNNPLPTPPQAPQQPTQPLPQAPTGVKAPPKPGTVQMHGTDKYVFLGGDPSNPNSWRKQ